MDIARRAPGDHDVRIDIPFCGVCHSDLHTVARRMGRHAVSLRAGPRDRRPRHRRSAPTSASFKVGDLVGVGCMVDSCRHCAACEDGPGAVLRERHGRHLQRRRPADAAGHTLGGYSDQIVVDEHFVLRVTIREADLAAAAPLLCAGITTYSPLRHWKAGPGQEGRHRRHRRPRPHGRQARARDGRACGRCSPPRRTRREDAEALGAHEVVVSKDAGGDGGACQHAST